MLAQGSQGDQVRQMQQELAALGYDPGPIDGIYGPRTAAAVAAFQQANLIGDPSGQAGDTTLGALASGAANPAGTTASTSGSTLPGAPPQDPTAAPQPAPAPAVPAPPPSTDLPAWMSQYEAIPELAAIIQEARDSQASTGVPMSQDIFLARVMATDWYRNHSDTQRAWDLTPPGQQAEVLATTRARILDAWVAAMGQAYVIANQAAVATSVEALAQAVANGTMPIDEAMLDIKLGAGASPDSIVGRSAQGQVEDFARQYFGDAQVSGNAAGIQATIADLAAQVAAGGLSLDQARTRMRQMAEQNPDSLLSKTSQGQVADTFRQLFGDAYMAANPGSAALIAQYAQQVASGALTIDQVNLQLKQAAQRDQNSKIFQDQKAQVDSTIRTWGINADDVIAQGIAQGRSTDQILAAIRGTDAYAAAFSGNLLRQRQGKGMLDEATYLSQLSQYRDTLTQYGLNPTTASLSALGNLIGGDVSNRELGENLGDLHTVVSTYSGPLQDAFLQHAGMQVTPADLYNMFKGRNAELALKYSRVTGSDAISSADMKTALDQAVAGERAQFHHLADASPAAVAGTLAPLSRGQV